MDLIHADQYRNEVGFVRGSVSYDADVSIGSQLSQNTFKLTMTQDEWMKQPIIPGHHVYLDGTEFGGIVGKVTRNSGSGTMGVEGVCWRGMLAARLIMPTSGSATRDYTNTDIGTIVYSIFSENTFSGLFNCPQVIKGVTATVSWRYPYVLTALSEMLDPIGYALKFSYNSVTKKVDVSVKQCQNVGDKELSTEYNIPITVTTGRVDAYNHIVALGSGDGTSQLVKELWMVEGVIYQSRPAEITEQNELTILLESQKSDTMTALTESASIELLKYGSTSGASFNLSGTGLTLELGDKISVYDPVLSVESTQICDSLVLKMTNSATKLESKLK